jgi:hypothetical protein
MIARIHQINETLAVWLTKAFGTMWICYVFMVYGLLPAFAIFHPYQASFLYWSNWIQLWSLPLILVGTNILGREAEKRSKLDHEKLARSYEEQQQTYRQVIAMLQKQEEMMADMLKQDRVLEAQDLVLAQQTAMLKQETLYFESNKAKSETP